MKRVVKVICLPVAGVSYLIGAVIAAAGVGYDSGRYMIRTAALSWTNKE